jgi:hypothetical protein
MVMGFNWYFDPYKRFGRRIDGAHAAGGATNLVLEAMAEVARMPKSAKQSAEVIILGDSRANGLTDVRLTSIEGHPVLNLGIGGASFEEMISFLNALSPRLTSARLLIIGTPLERFAGAPRPDRCLEVQPLVDHPMRYLANAEILKNSWDMWRKPPAQKMKKPKGQRPEPESKQDDEGVLSTWRRLYGDYDKDRVQARVKALRDAVKPFSTRGTAVVFWSPPLRQEIYSMIDQLDLQKQRAELVREIGNFGTVVDMTERDSVAGQKLTFKDPVHTNEGGLILKELLAAYPH